MLQVVKVNDIRGVNTHTHREIVSMCVDQVLQEEASVLLMDELQFPETW